MIIKEIVYSGSRYINVDSKSSILPKSILKQAIDDQKWCGIRVKRDNLIRDVDFTQMPDSPLTAEQKQAFADYRQALRDIPQTFEEPDSVVWPEKPTL